MNGICPNCGTKVPLESSVKLGYITYCPSCDVELEIVNLKPIELDYPFIYDDEEYEHETDDYDTDYDN